MIYKKRDEYPPEFIKFVDKYYDLLKEYLYDDFYEDIRENMEPEFDRNDLD